MKRPVLFLSILMLAAGPAMAEQRTAKIAKPAVEAADANADAAAAVEPAAGAHGTSPVQAPGETPETTGTPASTAPAAIPPEHAKAASSYPDEEPMHQHWHFKGMFGTYDKSSMQRGLKVFREVCSACHSLKRIYFRNLEDLGYDESQVKTIANEYTIHDGPNDEGEMFDRPGLPSDHFPSPFANDNAAKASNGGALPPDLSLITKARHHGPDYVFSILNGYEPAPADVVLMPGQNWNKYMHGHLIAMAKPLSDGQVAYEDNSPQTVEQYAHDVVNFLTWASDPTMETRKRTGIKVLIFLAIFAGVMYGVKRKIWADVH